MAAETNTLTNTLTSFAREVVAESLDERERTYRFWLIMLHATDAEREIARLKLDGIKEARATLGLVSRNHAMVDAEIAEFLANRTVFNSPSTPLGPMATTKPRKKGAPA